MAVAKGGGVRQGAGNFQAGDHCRNVLGVAHAVGSFLSCGRGQALRFMKIKFRLSNASKPIVKQKRQKLKGGWEFFKIVMNSHYKK